MPTKVAQQVLRLLDKNWQSYFAACAGLSGRSLQVPSHPKMPRYKHKTEGRNVLVYTVQALSRPGLKAGLIQPSSCPSPFKPNRPILPKSVSCPGSASTWWRWSMSGKKQLPLAIPRSLPRSILALTIWLR